LAGNLEKPLISLYGTECKERGFRLRFSVVKNFLIFVDISSAICFAVECWNKLDGNVGELSSWVQTKVSGQQPKS
jgi:hypothetical protein